MGSGARSNMTSMGAPNVDGVPLSCTLSLLLSLAALATSEVSSMIVASDRSHDDRTALLASLPMLCSALLIFCSRASRLRLPRKGVWTWTLRALLYGLALIFTLTITPQIQTAYYMNFVARCMGYFFVLESAIQHWLRRSSSADGSAFIVFLAMILFVLASRTYNPTYIKYFTPPFAVLLVFALRASRSRGRHGESGVSATPERLAEFENQAWPGQNAWIGALLCAVTLGGAMALAVSAHSAVLSRIIASIMRPRNIEDFSDTNARPMLGHALNTASSHMRMLKVQGSLTEHHLRGLAFDIYLANGAWGPGVDLQGNRDAALLRALPGGERLAVTPLLDSYNVLYVPLHMAGIDAPAYNVQWSRTVNGPIFAIEKKIERAPYQVAIADEMHRGPLTDSMNEPLKKLCLELPDNLDPKVIALAREIGGQLKDPREKMEAVRKHLWNNHSYSLYIEPGPGDPAANFLLKKLDGHCQYFASATVLLLRALGVPSRYVTGFYVHESPQPGEWIVRQRDAHAWTEVWLESEGWITFDTTPSSGMPGQLGPVNAWSKALEKIADWAEIAGLWLRDAPLKNIALMLLGVALSVLAIRYLRKRQARQRELHPALAYASPGQTYEALAWEFESYLRRHGIHCPSHTPWADHLFILKQKINRDDTQQSAPALAIRWDEAENFSRQYAAARFGAKTDADVLARLKEILTSLNAQG